MSQTSKKITKGVDINERSFIEVSEKVSSVSSLKEFIDSHSESSASDVVDMIMGAGVILSASDIHFEPEESGVDIRFRFDGVLQEITRIGHKQYRLLLSRLKLLSAVKLNITSVPQDGRFSVNFPKLKRDQKGRLVVNQGASKEIVDIRGSFLPSEHGESIVMRILNPKRLVDIGALGLRDSVKKLFEKEIIKPNGMIVVTGPTGSGKTTTLYAVLKKIKSPKRKIITIEDPVEYHLEGISQTGVRSDKGYTFANGLRTIVRQDPDVILVGEIRDAETASIALQAALTGHLVLTTLHTNDAAGAIARLQSLGEEAYNIAPAINIVVAQRLVRKVCSLCHKKEKVTKEEYEKLKKGLTGVTDIELSKESVIVKAVGCDACNNSGYSGRVGLFEIMEITPDMEKLILSTPSSYEIKEKAIKNGMLTMYQDGLIKVLNRETTIEEVERVTAE